MKTIDSLLHSDSEPKMYEQNLQKKNSLHYINFINIGNVLRKQKILKNIVNKK